MQPALVVLGMLGAATIAAAQPSPPAAAPAVADTPAVARSLVLHVAPLAHEAGMPIELVAQIDAPFAETLAVRWRVLGASSWQDATFERSSAGGWFATLPAARGPGVEYFIVGRDAGGQEVAHFASASAPHVVHVVPSLEDRLEELDRTRLGDRMNQVAVTVMGHNFGNRYDHRDDFFRGELAYTRRLLRPLHHLSFGFGSIQGSTPSMDGPEATDVSKGLRYGFGEARLRATPSVFFDVRGMLGASHEGFTAGIRGQVTLGKPWRSSLALGGELLGDVGPSVWVRLQWDTAPPFLMGASIVRTELPGSVITSSGLYLAYDAAYPIREWLSLRGQVTYGSRDGAAHFGGGIGTSIDF